MQRKLRDQKQCVYNKAKPPILLVTTPDGTSHYVYTNNEIINSCVGNIEMLAVRQNTLNTLI